jgi:Asp-tRNA(Asn)/Glu-tRNA(Gln) amidotransferase A subunit family amidase
MSHFEFCFMTATKLVRRIRAQELSCKEVMEAHLTQIERINPISQCHRYPRIPRTDHVAGASR